jgi:hypothetical protein
MKLSDSSKAVAQKYTVSMHSILKSSSRRYPTAPTGCRLRPSLNDWWETHSEKSSVLRETHQSLLSMLEAHISITEELMSVSEKALEHVLAFDIGPLSASIRRKQALTAQWERSLEALGDWISALSDQTGSDKPAPRSLSEVADILMGEEKERLTSTIQRLNEAMNSMVTVQAMTLVQADSSARLTRAYISMLRGDHHSEATKPSLYTARGHAKREHIASITLAHKA